jgi:hypothetical protein
MPGENGYAFIRSLAERAPRAGSRPLTFTASSPADKTPKRPCAPASTEHLAKPVHRRARRQAAGAGRPCQPLPARGRADGELSQGAARGVEVEVEVEVGERPCEARRLERVNAWPVRCRPASRLRSLRDDAPVRAPGGPSPHSAQGHRRTGSNYGPVIRRWTSPVVPLPGLGVARESPSTSGMNAREAPEAGGCCRPPLRRPERHAGAALACSQVRITDDVVSDGQPGSMGRPRCRAAAGKRRWWPSRRPTWSRQGKVFADLPALVGDRHVSRAAGSRALTGGSARGALVTSVEHRPAPQRGSGDPGDPRSRPWSPRHPGPRHGKILRWVADRIKSLGITTLYAASTS